MIMNRCKGLVVSSFIVLNIFSSPALADDRKMVNLARLSIASAYGIANGKRATDDPIYGVLNLFDGGTNIINNINYSSWLTNGGRDNWLIVKFAVPVEIAAIVIELKKTYYDLPETCQMHTRTDDETKFVNHGTIKLEAGRNKFTLPAPVNGAREVLLTFIDPKTIGIDEIQILGFAPANTNLTQVKPTVAHETRKQLFEFPLACDSLPQSAQLTFKSAFPEDGQTLRFTPFIEIDWKNLAPKWLRNINIGNPSPEIKKRLKAARHGEFHSSEIRYDTALNECVTKGYYYFISSHGITELKLLKLIGGAHFDDVSEEGTASNEARYYGDVIAATVNNTKITEGGFVMFSATRLPPVANEALRNTGKIFSALLEEKQVHYKYIKAGSELRLTKRDLHPVTIVKSYGFNMQDDLQDYIFVKWESDEECHYGCCAFNFSLFRADDRLQELEMTRYDCDL
jgi:hypothetical protein